MYATSRSKQPPRRPLPPHQLVLAPMVGGSELAFRLLARKHGAQLAYTPMIKSELFLSPKRTERGIGQLEVHPGDAPLVAHFSANDPAMLLAAAKRAVRTTVLCCMCVEGARYFAILCDSLRYLAIFSDICQ